MNINYESKRNEAIAAVILDRLVNGFPTPEVGDEIGYEVRYGDEGPDRWTRGEAEVTQEHIDEAKRMLKALIGGAR